MTTPADDAAVEDAFEAYLAGRPVSTEAADIFAGLAAFSEAVRATATRPGRPNAALAELLVTGRLTDQSSPSLATARTAGSPPPRRAARVRIRRRTAMLFPALLAKLLSAGAIAQAATGAGLAVVVVTGAGAADVLPDPVQNTVSSVVETVTPFDMPSGEEPAVEDPATEEPVVEEPEAEQSVVEQPEVEQPEEEQPVVETPAEFSAAAWLEGPQDGESFGAWVSNGAHHKAELGTDVRFGEIVSAKAHEKHMDAKDLAGEGVDLDELSDDAASKPTSEVEPATDDDQKVATSTRGNGHGKSDAAKSNSKSNSKSKSKSNGNSEGHGHN